MSEPRNPFRQYECETWIEDESWAERSSDGFGRRAQVLSIRNEWITVRCGAGDPKELGGITAFYSKSNRSNRGVVVTEPTSYGTRAPFLRFYES